MQAPEKFRRERRKKKITSALSFQRPLQGVGEAQEVHTKFEAKADFRCVIHKWRGHFFLLLLLWRNMMRAWKQRQIFSVYWAFSFSSEPRLLTAGGGCGALKQFDCRRVITFFFFFFLPNFFFGLLRLVFAAARDETRSSARSQRRGWDGATAEACSNRRWEGDRIIMGNFGWDAVFPTTSRWSQNRSQQASRSDTATVFRFLLRAATLLRMNLLLLLLTRFWGKTPPWQKTTTFWLFWGKRLIPAELDFHNKSWIKVSFDPLPLFFWCSTEHDEATRKSGNFCLKTVPEYQIQAALKGCLHKLRAPYALETSGAAFKQSTGTLKGGVEVNWWKTAAVTAVIQQLFFFLQQPGGTFPEIHLIYFKYPFRASVFKEY